MNEEKILSALYRAVDQTNQQLPKQRQIEKAPQTILFGKAGGLDSLGLVSFIVEVEQEIADEFGIAITLADERAMSQTKSPFLTLQTLADYVSVLMKDHEPAA